MVDSVNLLFCLLDMAQTQISMKCKGIINLHLKFKFSLVYCHVLQGTMKRLVNMKLEGISIPTVMLNTTIQ